MTCYHIRFHAHLTGFADYLWRLLSLEGFAPLCAQLRSCIYGYGKYRWVTYIKTCLNCWFPKAKCSICSIARAVWVMHSSIGSIQPRRRAWSCSQAFSPTPQPSSALIEGRIVRSGDWCWFWQWYGQVKQESDIEVFKHAQDIRIYIYIFAQHKYQALCIGFSLFFLVDDCGIRMSSLGCCRKVLCIPSCSAPRTSQTHGRLGRGAGHSRWTKHDARQSVCNLWIPDCYLYFFIQNFSICRETSKNDPTYDIVVILPGFMGI